MTEGETVKRRAPKTGIKKRRLQSGALSYGIDYVDASGRRVREWGFPTAELAKKARAQRIAEAAAGRMRIPTSKQLFREYAEEWLVTNKARLKPSTYRLYEAYLRTHLLPYFGSAPLSRMAIADVRRFVAQMAATGTSPKSVNNVLVLLKTVLKGAEQDGLIGVNPAASVKRLKWHRPEMQFLTPAEVSLFLKNTSPDCHTLFLVGFTTGLRLGELLGLQWGDIDFASGFLHVRRSVYRHQYLTPKSEYSARKVMLIPAARQSFLAYRTRVNAERLVTRLPGAEPTTPVFWDPRMYSAEKMIRRQFQRTLRRAGLPAIRLHDMRHTFASLLIHQGESPKFIQRQMGHSSIETTFDLYGHLFPESYEGAANRLQAALFGQDRQPIGPQEERGPSEVAESRVLSSV